MIGNGLGDWKGWYWRRTRFEARDSPLPSDVELTAGFVFAFFDSRLRFGRFVSTFGTDLASNQ